MQDNDQRFFLSITKAFRDLRRSREGIKLIKRTLEERDRREVDRKENYARFEAISIVLCSREEVSSKIFGSLQNVYHSRRVIGIYAPITASLATVVTVLLIHPFPQSSSFLIIGLVSVMLFAISILSLRLRRIWKYVNEHCIYHSIIVAIHLFIALYAVLILTQMRTFLGFVSFLSIFFVSLMMIWPTCNKGLLRMEIDELERSILLL